MLLFVEKSRSCAQQLDKVHATVLQDAGFMAVIRVKRANQASAGQARELELGTM